VRKEYQYIKTSFHQSWTVQKFIAETYAYKKLHVMKQ